MWVVLKVPKIYAKVIIRIPLGRLLKIPSNDSVSQAYVSRVRKQVNRMER